MTRSLLHDTVAQGDSKGGLYHNCTYEVFRIFVSMVHVSDINHEVCQIMVIDLAGEKPDFLKVSMLISFTINRNVMQVVFKSS